MADSSCVNGLELRVVGMSRSGNHAIINWLLEMEDEARCFLNCAEPRTNPFFSARPLGHGNVYETNISDFDLEGERQGHFARKNLLLHSYEDVFLGGFGKKKVTAMHDQWVGPSRRMVDVLIRWENGRWKRSECRPRRSTSGK